MEFRPADTWLHLFDECRRSAFHMEVRDSYAEPSESEPLRRFLRGESGDYDKSDWTSLIRGMTSRDVVVSRIRVITEPHSDYQRWLLSVTGESVDAGEDIRYIGRSSVDPLLVPADDWWIFDDELVAFNLSDTDGKPTGAAITTDPGIVTRCRNVKETLWPLSTKFYDYYTERVK
ncbi:DUF6879 family protein [Nocardia jiangxiensis]|uniref:DUF6879 family protein n=1 Tax=Nocardia jiangxiensis TaxID=282685 RepID=A0ABW6S1G8_9NOCA